MGEKKEDPEAYLKRRRIRELFQSLMAGILYHKPADHVAFLKTCLWKLHEDPLAIYRIRWNTFIDMQAPPAAGAGSAPRPEEIAMQLETLMTGMY